MDSCSHEKTELKNIKNATCTEDGYSGDKYCIDCGKLIESGTAVKATDNKYADGKCTVCGETDPNYKPTDVDSDGKVTSKEARSVLRFAAKLQNKIYE